MGGGDRAGDGSGSGPGAGDGDGSGGRARRVSGGALVAAVLVTLWWGFTGLGTENFGSDCLHYFGETGARAGQCRLVNGRAAAWLPRLVTFVWACAVLGLFLPLRIPSARPVITGTAFAGLLLALALGTHALVVSTP